MDRQKTQDEEAERALARGIKAPPVAHDNSSKAGMSQSP